MNVLQLVVNLTFGKKNQNISKNLLPSVIMVSGHTLFHGVHTCKAETVFFSTLAFSLCGFIKIMDECMLLDVTKYDHRLWDCGDD